jgi:Co/Zn/Cd efflux system component
MVPDGRTQGFMRERLEVDGDRVSDLHLWQIGPGHRAAIVTIVTDRPQAPAAYKDRLRGIAGLSHVTVEVEPCRSSKGRHRAA